MGYGRVSGVASQKSHSNKGWLVTQGNPTRDNSPHVGTEFLSRDLLTISRGFFFFLLLLLRSYLVNMLLAFSPAVFNWFHNTSVSSRSNNLLLVTLITCYSFWNVKSRCLIYHIFKWFHNISVAVALPSRGERTTTNEALTLNDDVVSDPWLIAWARVDEAAVDKFPPPSSQPLFWLSVVHL